MNKDDQKAPPSLGYANWQIAKALRTSETHIDPKVRDNAHRKVRQWEQVIENLWSESYELGSRTPIEGTPSWVTLEVVTGGFATGNFMAGGDLVPHEIQLLDDLDADCERADTHACRLWLNSYFLSEDGLRQLQSQLSANTYRINAPEEGALLFIAWLLQHGEAKKAEHILTQIAPYFAELRFYPQNMTMPNPSDMLIHLQNVGQTVKSLRNIERNERVAIQKIQSTVWIPFYDRVVSCFLESAILDPDFLAHESLQHPSKHMPNDALDLLFPERWQAKAQALLNEFSALKQRHGLTGKFAKKTNHQAILLELFSTCCQTPATLTAANIKRIQHILACYIKKRGKPESEKHREQRLLQQNSVRSPLYHDIATVLAKRFKDMPKHHGVDNIEAFTQPINTSETTRSVAAESVIPQHIINKVRRCENQDVDTLVTSGQISSSEQLALVLPQITSSLNSIAITDSDLQQLFSHSYQAFRKRRSLLLLNLEKQVQFEELPWIQAIEPFRNNATVIKSTSHESLKKLASLTLAHFPHSILPNSLLQEITALANNTDDKLPLVEELAVDIFMGQFSPKFTKAALQASDIMQGTLYARYYEIDYANLRSQLTNKKEAPKSSRFSIYRSKNRHESDHNNALAEICAARAGASLGSWDTTANGMIIEQQQILTTQNLAVVCSQLDLLDKLPLQDMAQSCFKWICKRLQANSDSWHAQLIKIKNSAYAWRQMLFYLSFGSQEQQTDFLQWANAYLATQNTTFSRQFKLALNGLAHVQSGLSFADSARNSEPYIAFLGWTKEKHWLMNNQYPHRQR